MEKGGERWRRVEEGGLAYRVEQGEVEQSGVGWSGVEQFVVARKKQVGA